MSAYRRWAFAPIDTAPMAALRVACGLLVLAWTISFIPDISAFLADDGLTAKAVGGTKGWWTIDLVSPYAALALLGLAAVALTVGWHTRIVAVLVAVLLVAVQRRDVYVLNSGDLLLRLLAIYVALMPAGEVWSLDARRRGSSSPRAPWGLRMLQIQVSLLYFFSVVAKLHGDNWQDGTAVGRAVQLGDLQRFLIPESLSTNIGVSAMLTYGTIIVEGALVFGLWLPRFRWFAMAAGVSIHLGIEATLLIGWFSFAIIACYLAFVPAEVLRTVVDRVTERIRPAAPAPVPVSASLPAGGPIVSPYPVGSAASTYTVLGGQEQGDQRGESFQVRLAPSEGVRVDEGLGEPDEGVGDLVERHGEGEVVDVVDEQLLDPVDDIGLDAPAVVGEQAEGEPGVGLDGSAEPWVFGAEPGVSSDDREAPGPPAGPPGQP
ncbi:MAG: HTTM domain-containing protein [Actinomycetota bacterium]|nr:HTTM domain-containing protein [Actinomycetota bacterium]